MKKCLVGLILVFSIVISCLFTTTGIYAASVEVTKSGNNYVAKVDGKNISNSDLATVINSAIGIGNDVTIRCGGNLSKTIQMANNSSLTFDKGQQITKNGGYAINAKKKNNLSISGLVLKGSTSMGIRLTGCSNIKIKDCNISGAGIGIRIDTDEKNPWDFPHVKGLEVNNVSFSKCEEHGLETYSVDDYKVDNITGTDLGGCAVLINDGNNGVIGTVSGTNCSPNAGYAALRFANDCNKATVKKVYARNCGRGFFTVTNSKNITVESVDIANCGCGILIQQGGNVKVMSGTVSKSVDTKGRSIIIQESPGSDASGVKVTK